ncbi:hypothetical protein [uncultured Roseobacter sp.]|uniref:hypothetical protein n=1 Tax=uncultured Roseobacter sp. TaxID=114847 RepID=UPI00262D0402|nr:hypothetical protein [uncultured Roseobacter sp.]
MSALALLTCAAVAPGQSKALGLDIFLIAEQSVPTTSSVAPLTVGTQTVYQLGNLNGNDKATSASLVAQNFSFDIDTALTFSSLTDPSSGPSSADPTGPWRTDQGENGAAANASGAAGDPAYVNSQISTWDNSGISGTTVEADEQLDFGRNSFVTFNSVLGGFTDLVIADLGGIDPFKLSLCSDADCSVATQVFDGFTKGVRNFLTDTGLFALDDSGEASTQDQTWLFRFHSPVTDYVRVTESGQRKIFGGSRLQADFIGAKSVPTDTNGDDNDNTPSPVPGPASLPLLAGGIVLLGWARRRRTR